VDDRRHRLTARRVTRVMSVGDLELRRVLLTLARSSEGVNPGRRAIVKGSLKLGRGHVDVIRYLMHVHLYKS